MCVRVVRSDLEWDFVTIEDPDPKRKPKERCLVATQSQDGLYTDRLESDVISVATKKI